MFQVGDFIEEISTGFRHRITEIKEDYLDGVKGYYFVDPFGHITFTTGIDRYRLSGPFDEMRPVVRLRQAREELKFKCGLTRNYQEFISSVFEEAIARREMTEEFDGKYRDGS